MTPHDEADDAARDAHLLAALRHAPDRDATPPPEITARIIAAARAAVRTAAPPSWTQRLAAWWRQPPLGAAFGTLMAALLVGVLWSTREPPPVMPEPSAAAPAPATSEAAAPTAAAPPAPAVERDAGLAASRDRASTADASREVAAAQSTRPAPAAKTEAARRPAEPAPEVKARVEQRAAQQRRADVADPAVAAASPQPAPAAAADATSRSAPPAVPAAGAMSRPAAPAEPAAEAMSKSAPPPPTSRDKSQNQTAANDAKLLRDRGADRLGSRLEPREGAAAAASVPMPSALGRLNQAQGAAADPLTRFDAALAAPDAALHASWRSTGSTRAVAHGTAQHAWWRELRAATQGRWQSVPAPPAAMPWLTLTIDGFERARWWLDADQLVLADADGRSAWRVPVSEPQRRAWSQAIAGW